MTQDEIIEMAIEAGWKDLRNFDSEMHEFLVMGSFKDLERFANLVAAKEREACAKACAEDGSKAMDFTGGTFVGGYFARAIRARGEQA